MVDVGALRRIGKVAGRVEVVGVLLEEERRLAVRVVAHLDRMRRVVAADAVDPPHREARVGAEDRQRHPRGRLDHEVVHGHTLPRWRRTVRAAGRRVNLPPATIEVDDEPAGLTELEPLAVPHRQGCCLAIRRADAFRPRLSLGSG